MWCESINYCHRSTQFLVFRAEILFFSAIPINLLMVFSSASNNRGIRVIRRFAELPEAIGVSSIQRSIASQSGALKAFCVPLAAVADRYLRSYKPLGVCWSRRRKSLSLSALGVNIRQVPWVILPGHFPLPPRAFRDAERRIRQVQFMHVENATMHIRLSSSCPTPHLIVFRKARPRHLQISRHSSRRCHLKTPKLKFVL